MAKKIAQILAWVGIFQLIGFGLGYITAVNILPWYVDLHKSIFTPQAIVFAVVWPILYTLLALAGWSLWQCRMHPNARLAWIFFSIQMLLNWAWSLLFFHFHRIALGFYCLLLILLCTLLILIFTKDNFKGVFVLLTPYFIWLLFAAYLNGVIWMLN